MTDDVFDAIRDTFLLTLELLRLAPTGAVITCRCCNGKSPEPEFCGCGGKQTVAEAIAFIESQLEVLGK